MTMGWIMWERTHSEIWLGSLAFLMFFPTVIFGPLFGVLVDRVNRLRAAIVTSLILAFISGALAIVVYVDWGSQYVLLIFAAVIGIANSAYQSIRLSFVPELVSLPNMPKAVAINGILYNTSRFVGPMIAGYLMLNHGNDITLTVVATCYLPLIFVLCRIDVAPNIKSSSTAFTFFGDIKEGLNYALASQVISRLLVAIGISAILGRGLLEILPATIDIIYNMGVKELAWLNSAVGAGSILAALLLSNATEARLQAAVKWGVIGAGILLVGFNASSRFELGLIIIAGLGFFATLCGVGSQALIQVSVVNEFRGRVMSLWGAINVGGGAIGGLIFGIFTEHAGYMVTLSVLGSVCILVAFAINTRRCQ